jgi:hypothetical protein
MLALAREGAKYGVLVVAAGAILMVKKVRGANTRVQPMRARAGVHKQTLRPRAHTVESRRLLLGCPQPESKPSRG